MSNENDKIAIIGMACRFPGANTIAQFWENLRTGTSSINQFSDDELISAGVDKADLDDPDYVKAGAWLDDPDCFDAAFFGYNPHDAAMMDPQHRVFLECAWSALEDAGINTANSEEVVAVYGGIARNTYMLDRFAANPDLLHSSGDYQSMIAGEKDFTATRVAFKLNLNGPAIDIQTACSSAGVAIHLACQGLIAGDSTVALAGGGRIQAPLNNGYRFTEGGTQSPDGYCRAFDADAKGMVRGSGMGFIVLKRLDDALADGDTVHAVIRGTAINNDGSSKVGFTAPGLQGQTDVIGDALAIADVNPEDITYVEAHGTGTELGDPIEIAALTRAYREHTEKSGYCQVGSVKTNIGHLDAGAAIAGVIKTVLALKHGEIPPTLNFKQANPQIDFEHSPFYVSPKLQAWPDTSPTRIAGISSFGLGGTNFHAVLENYQQPEPSEQSRAWQLLPLSAKSEESLTRMNHNLEHFIKDNAEQNIADAAFTLQTTRERFNYRQFAVIENHSDSREHLIHDQNWSVIQNNDANKTDIVFMFSGQGAQYVNMARGLYESESVFRENVDHCALLLNNKLEKDLLTVLYPADDDIEQATEAINQTALTQPALFVTEYALARLWMSWGIEPEAMIGHSIGEYVAACLAGVFTLEQAINLVVARGQLMQKQPAGSMLAVPLSEPELQNRIPASISIATINTTSSTVVSGPEDAITELQTSLESEGINCRILHTSHAFHSSMMDEILKPFEAIIKEAQPEKPRKRFISNLSGTWITDEQATDPAYWAQHLRYAVRFHDGLSECLSLNNPTFIEIGPGRTLCSFALQHEARKPHHTVISSVRHPKEEQQDQAVILKALGQSWMAGAIPDWDSFYQYESRIKCSLPTYAFERKRHWLDGDKFIPNKNTAIESGITTEESETISTDAESTLDHAEKIRQNLKQLLSDMSGLTPEQIAPQSTFLELGLDSLALTQVCLSLKKQFSVNISFRQVMEELTHLEALANYIEQNTEEKAETPTSTASPVTRITQESRETATVTDLMSTDEPEIVTGPWKAINKQASTELSEQQQKHLGKLIDDIISKSPASKTLTQENRARLADARTVSGFRKLWKEVVYPIVAERSSGSRLWDIDGNEFIDVAMGFGVNLFGHSPEFVTKAIRKQLQKGYDIGPQTPLAGEVATLFSEMTGQERVAFCNTGSEAVLAAIRIARTVTAKDKIVIFSGSYHGIFDEVLVKGLQNNGRMRSLPVAPGILPEMLHNVIVLEYGKKQSLGIILEQSANIAAVLVEPVQSRHPDTQPVNFLKALRKLTEQNDIALVFDEMITGFRSHTGGTQALWGIKADIATYGKVIGGGMPIGIVSGKHRFLDALDGGMWQYGDDSVPEAGVTWFAGTFVRHPLALAASHAVLKHLQEQGDELQTRLSKRTRQFVDELNQAFTKMGAPIHVETFSSFFHMKYKSHQEYSTLLYLHLRNRGIHITEGRSSFFSTAHSDEDFDSVKQAIIDSVADLQSAGFLPMELERGLTDGQMEVWFACCLGDDASCAYNLSNRIQLHGHLDTNKLQSALVSLVNRHDALRMTIDSDGIPDYQPQVQQVELALSDLSTLDTSEQQAALEKAAKQDVETAYDLECGPLYRFNLFKQGEEEHTLYLGVHHIICDGWSTGILMKDLGRLYSKQFDDSITLPEPMQFSEYSNWQKEEAQQAQTQKSLDYWTNIHKNPAPTPELPLDHPRPALRSFNANRVSRTLDRALASAIKQSASSKNTTIFNFLLTAFETLVYRLTRQNDFAIGISAAGQTQVDKELLGHCVYFLPLRINMDGEQGYDDLLKSTQTKLFEALENQYSTYGALLNQIDLPRDPGRIPLLSIIFNIDQSAQGIDFHGLSTDISSNARHYEAFELFFNIVINPEAITLECTYNTDLFQQSSVEHWLGLYINLLNTVVAETGNNINNVNILDDNEKALLLDTWNQTQLDYPKNDCLHTLVSRQAQSTPEKIAVIQDDQSLTYRELDERSNQLANYLQQFEIKPDSMIGLSVDRSVEMIICLLGILKAGGTYVPLDPDFPKERLEFMMQDSGLHVLVTQSDLAEHLPTHTGHTLHIDTDIDKINQCNTTTPAINISPDNLAYMIYTSGSTGKPKGVQVTHNNVVNFLHSMKQKPGINENDKLLAVTTLSFDIAVLELYLPLISGAQVIIPVREDVTDGPRLLKLIDSMSPSIMQATPATWRMLVAAGWKTTNMKILCGGEALPADLVSVLLERADEVWNMYGPTETTVWSSCFPIRNTNDPIYIGKPVANTLIYILDDNKQPVPIGVPGELYIGGDGVTRGYHKRDELTRERYIDNPFTANTGKLYRTGDLVRYHNDGNLEYLNRLDNQVKVRGYRIELGEIESAISSHNSIHEVVVVIKEYQAEDLRLIAYFTINPGSNVNPTELRKHLRQTLPDYMIPQMFIELQKIPLTANGKVDRKNLPDLDAHVTNEPTQEPPSTPCEKAIAAIWKEILATDNINIYDNFFEIGGHSLLATQAIITIQKELGIHVSLRALISDSLQQIANKYEDDFMQQAHQSTEAEKKSGLLNKLIQKLKH